MDGPAKFKVFVILLLVTTVIVLYKYQNLLEISVDIQRGYVGSTIVSDVAQNIPLTTVISDDEKPVEAEEEKDAWTSIQETGTMPSVKNSLTVNNVSISDDVYNDTADGRSNFICVDPAGDFLSRVESYNIAISELRHYVLDKRQYKPWQDVQAKLDVLFCYRDDFMDVLKNYTFVKTVLLSWRDAEAKTSWSAMEDNSNILIKQYYKWTANEPLCKWIATPGKTNGWGEVYNGSCDTDMELASQVVSIEPLYFHGKPINVRYYWPNDGLSYPQYFYDTYPDYLIYMHIIEDSIIVETGDIVSNNLKLVPFGCNHASEPRPPLRYETSSIYEEVFLLSQVYGYVFYHFMIEDIPRLAPYMKFLLDNPSVRIHVVEPKPYIRNTLKFLGLNPERLISNIARAKLLYVPQATPCGYAQIHEIQLLNRLYRAKLDELHPNITATKIVFIRRSGRRKFLDNAGVEATVARAARDFALPFEVFRDDPSPGIEAAMALFHAAALVVSRTAPALPTSCTATPARTSSRACATSRTSTCATSGLRTFSDTDTMEYRPGVDATHTSTLSQLLWISLSEHFSSKLSAYYKE